MSTVLGAGGTVTVPFDSASNAAFANQIAAQISAAVTGGTLYQSPTIGDTTGTPGPGQTGEVVIGGLNPTPATTTNYALPNSYTAVINNASNPVTITAGASPSGALSVIGGTGGTTFFAGSSVGGSIALGGGTNLIAGSASLNGAIDSTNGGLTGNWNVDVGSTAPGASNQVYLASGDDVVNFGAGDTINAGGAHVLGAEYSTAAANSTFFIGSGDSTVFGLGSADLAILGNNAAGGGVYVLGTGGNGVAVAGENNTTLVGGGGGDLLFANSAPGAQAILFAGAGNETLQAGGEGGSSTLYGGSGNDALSGGKGNDVIEAGSGHDTIWTGLGNDSVWFYNKASNGTAVDQVVDFNIATSTLLLAGYSSGPSVVSAVNAPLTIKLGDNSLVTFDNLNTQSYASIHTITV